MRNHFAIICKYYGQKRQNSCDDMSFFPHLFKMRGWESWGLLQIHLSNSTQIPWNKH